MLNPPNFVHNSPLEDYADTDLHTPARQYIVGGVVRLGKLVDRAVAAIYAL